MSIARRITLLVLLAIILACFAPLGAYFWSEWAAARWECDFASQLARQNGCIVDGVDRAPVLARAYSAVALLVVTVPVAFVAAIIGVIILARKPKG
ncbi:hypothetical protein [Shimia sp. Alg240-R146]|uniref:hypothetical protein n=1 Tax=Shimia sp. Alg240-R146 TaxID=2993449 RepID=UPI0022DF20DF|nr:hypothetical protein [Shimia sp. Alg240-R146]